MGSTTGELKVTKLPPKLYKYNNEGHRDATGNIQTLPFKGKCKNKLQIQVAPDNNMTTIGKPETTRRTKKIKRVFCGICKKTLIPNLFTPVRFPIDHQLYSLYNRY